MDPHARTPVPAYATAALIEVSGRRTQITELAVRAAVDDNDFARP